jgi:hypothetical protein
MLIFRHLRDFFYLSEVIKIHHVFRKWGQKWGRKTGRQSVEDGGRK